MRRVHSVQFVQPVPVFGTSARSEYFDASSGWQIDVDSSGVRLFRPARPEQNVSEVKAYRVVGVGWCEPEVDHVEAGVQGDGASAAAPAAAEQRADAGGAPEATKPPQGGPKKASRRVTS